MVIDFSKSLRNLDGSEIKERNSSTSEPVVVTLGDVIKSSLVTATEQAAKMTTEQRVKRFELAVKMSKPKVGDLEVVSSDIETMKKALEESQYAAMPLIFGQVYKMLDGSKTGLEAEEPVEVIQ
jgi:hypothetical protein